MFAVICHVLKCFANNHNLFFLTLARALHSVIPSNSQCYAFRHLVTQLTFLTYSLHQWTFLNLSASFTRFVYAILKFAVLEQSIQSFGCLNVKRKVIRCRTYFISPIVEETTKLSVSGLTRKRKPTITISIQKTRKARGIFNIGKYGLFCVKNGLLVFWIYNRFIFINLIVPCNMLGASTRQWALVCPEQEINPVIASSNNSGHNLSSCTCLAHFVFGQWVIFIVGIVLTAQFDVGIVAI